MKTHILSKDTISQERLIEYLRYIPLLILAILSAIVIGGHFARASYLAIDIAFLLSLVITVNWVQREEFSIHSYRRIMGFGTLTGLATSGYILVLEHIMSLRWFSINRLIDFNLDCLATLSLALLALWTIHITFYQIQKKIQYGGIQSKLVFYSIVIVCLIISNFKSIETALISTLIGSIYFLLLDLFADQKRLSIIWLVLWTIILGSFLAFFIFHIERSIIADSSIPLINAFSLFSLIFVLSAILYVPIALANGKMNFLPLEWEFKFSKRSQLSNRVQYSILLTLVFSFVAIGIVSIYQIQILAPVEIGASFQHNFTQALLNTYVFLFLIGFVISISLSEYIRTPLVELGKTLKAVKLNKENKKIIWEGSDEIANLIQEYNHMIDQLQENAKLLAHTERDSAWREMSKQVAHEIKNPLTPMKLSLQHLQMSIHNKKDNIEGLTLKMCKTLMDQVENLRQIAEEFANFGSLPKANNEKILLNDIVETIHDLFRKREDMDITLIEPIDDIAVYADKNHLVRILNNLIKNSVQAIPTDRKGNIQLRLWKEETKAVIHVKDNGSGIPIDMQSQIFKPNFTTKSSGSGLGLAIAANMVDSMGGSIYFESSENIGTDFFVELPLVRETFAYDVERVSL